MKTRKDKYSLHEKKLSRIQKIIIKKQEFMYK